MADDEADQEGDNYEIVSMVQEWYRLSKAHTEEWRQEAREMYDMVAGRQWSEADLDNLKNQRRPAITINRIARTINAIEGTQVNNRQETRYIPREMGDVKVNEMYTSAAEWVRDNCDAEDEESASFEDMLIAGMGWTDTAMNYEEDPDGMTEIGQVDPLRMYWDVSAHKRNLKDARWVMHLNHMSPDEVEERFPDVNIENISDKWDEGLDEEEGGSPREHVYPQDAYRETSAKSGAGKPKNIRVAQVQWASTKKMWRIGPEAKVIDDEEAFAALKPELDAKKIKYIEQETRVWKQVFIAGDEVLEEGECPFPDGPTLKCMTYKRDRNRRTFYGIVRDMTDPQRFGNKFFSQILDIMNKGAKGGIMAEKDAFDDPRKAEQNWAKPDGIIWLRPGAIAGGKVQEKPIVKLPAGLERLMQFALDGVHDVTGVNLEMLGMADREQAGILEHQRKQAGLTIIAPLFDALRSYRKEQGRVLLHFIKTYLSDGRLIRILGENGVQQYVPLMRQEDAGKYDIIVDEAPTSPNMKEKTFGVLSELLPTLLKMGVPLPPSVLDYAPIPSKLSEEWKQMIEQAQGQANPEALQQQLQEMQGQMQKMGEENAQLKDKRGEVQANMQMKAQEMQGQSLLKQEEFKQQMALKAQELELKRQELIEDAKLEREKMMMTMELERDKAIESVKLEMQRSMQDLDMKRQQMAEELLNKGMGSLGDGNMSVKMADGRTVNIERGPDGAVINTSIADPAPKKAARKRVTVIRDEMGDIAGANIDEDEEPGPTIQ